MMTKACKKRVWVSSELGDLSTIFEVEESRLSEKDGLTSLPTCEHQSSYELKAESMNTRKIRWCTKILRELMDHNGGWIFNHPVDPVLYGIPDYFDVIRNPMDLGTVKKKLTNRQYVSTDEFAADVRLTFSNAMKYNPPGNDVHAIAKQLNGIFDSKWESVKKKFRGPSPFQEQKTIFTKACKKRRGVCVSSKLGNSSTDFEVDESRLSKKDGVTPIPTCEHQSSYKLKAESLNTRKIRLCGSIVRKLIDYKGGWLFKDPVDPVLYGIPDYFDVIRNPMDLGTVKNKLTKKKYVSIEEFAADVRLTFSNAMKYNPPGNDVHTVAKELNRVFDLLWESMKRKFRGPSPVQEQKTIFTEVQALMDSKSTIGCSNSKPSVIRRPVACSNLIAKKPLPDALSFKVKIISFVGSDEQISSKAHPPHLPTASPPPSLSPHSSSPSPTPPEPKTSWPRRFASRRRKAEPVPVPATLIPSSPRRLSPSKKREPLGVAGEHAPPPFPAPSVRAVGEARASTPIRSALTARRRRIWEGREPGPAHPRLSSAPASAKRSPHRLG